MMSGKSATGNGNPRTRRSSYRIFVLATLVIGMSLLATLTDGFSTESWFAGHSTTMLLWISIVVVAALSPIPLPRERTSILLLPALDLGAIVLFGPVAACWTVVLSRFLANAKDGIRNLLPGAQQIGQGLVAAGGAGLVYRYAGGASGEALLFDPIRVLPILAAGLTYVLLNISLGGIHRRLVENTFDPRLWRTQFRRVALLDFSLLPFGVLLALTQIRIGPVGVALFLVPLLLARYIYRLWIDSRASHVDTVRTLMTAVDAADPFTRGHSYRIAKMSVRIGREIGLNAAEIEELEIAALLHDIGRTAIKREILIKPGKLTDREQSVLRTHPRVGFDIVSRMQGFEGAADIVLSHHEQPDGNGYPSGLSGDAIPIGSRIIMVVSAFDAMTSDRPYRRGLTPEAAFEELRAQSGTQFDPQVVDCLHSLFEAGQLFEEFESEVLANYSNGQANSRALDEHLRFHSVETPVPEKTGNLPDAESDSADGVPVIELPAVKPPQVRVEGKFELDHDGSWRLESAGRSDVGSVRQNNEDSFGLFRAGESAPGCLLVIADGMGGHAAGEVASTIAVEKVHEAFVAGETDRVSTETLVHAIDEANREIHRQSTEDADLHGMGTTCTAIAIRGRRVVMGHVGDTRAYLVRGEEIHQISRDHTVSAELASLGGSKTQVSPGASEVLTRCLGQSETAEVDLTEWPSDLESGDVLVLCSDGLSNLVDPGEIREMALDETPDEACQSMVDLARARGGPDNITVVVGRVHGPS